MKEQEQQTLIDEYSAKHGGRIEAYGLDDGSLIIIAPPQNPGIEYKRYLDGVTAKDESTGQAQEDFALTCVVYPKESSAVRALFNKYPAIAADLAKDGADLLAGGIKKLGKAQRTPNKTT